MNWLPFRKNPPADRWSEAPDSDARLAGPHLRPRGEDVSEAGRALRRRRRAVVIVVFTLFMLAAIGALVGEGGVTEKQELRREVSSLGVAVLRQEAEVLNLRAEIERLEGDSLARERIAREQLGLVREGEIDFLLPRPGLLLPPAETGAP